MESRQLAYLAKDTKTYMNLTEARFKYSNDNDKNLLFILIPKQLRSNLRERMEQTVNPELWDEVIWIDTHSNSIRWGQPKKEKESFLYRFYSDVREYICNYIDRLKLDRIAAKYAPCDMVFSAHKNTQEHLAAMLKPKELVMVDSGHRIFKRMNNDGFIDYSRWFIAHSRFSRYMFWATGLKVFDREKTRLFTVYADEIETNHSVDKNNFKYQHHLLRSKEIGDDIVWISTPIYVMADGVSIEDYISYIKFYIGHLEIDPTKLTYIPHPGKQKEEEIELIGKKLGCKIDDRDIPVEFKLANYEKLPRMCISPFSSALVNVNVATDERIEIVSAWHYEFNHFKMWLNWKKDVEKNPELNIRFLQLDDCPPLFHIKKDGSEDIPMYNNFSDWENDQN